MRFEVPGDIDDEFDLEITIGNEGEPGFSRIFRRGLTQDKGSEIGHTGYEFFVDFIYHGSFVKDFAILRVIPARRHGVSP